MVKAKFSSASPTMLEEVVDTYTFYWRSVNDAWVGSHTQSKEERGKEGLGCEG